MVLFGANIGPLKDATSLPDFLVIAYLFVLDAHDGKDATKHSFRDLGIAKDIRSE